jgi:arabinose-5-phosphate isomerase
MANASRDSVARLRRNTDHRTRPARGLLEEAQDVLRQQARALEAVADRLDGTFLEAVDAILATTGKVVFFGLGKSGLIAQKLAATFASTGTPSFFVHAAEAHHGDLGMINDTDIAILVSCSGETREVVELLPHLKHMGVVTIALVGRTESALGSGSDIALDASVSREACPNNLAPTTSTVAAMALGDALAVALMRRRDFGADDFARLHPGGSLGRSLKVRVKDAMRTHNLPICKPTESVGHALVRISEGRLGLVLVMNGPRLVGLVTDGDLRRGIQRHDDLLSLPVSTIMTENPVTIDENVLLNVALHRMQQMKLKALVAVNTSGGVTGIVDVFENQ